MITFLDWLGVRDTEALLRLLESAEYFDPVAYNPVFENELEKLLDRIHDPEVRNQIEGLEGLTLATTSLVAWSGRGSGATRSKRTSMI